MIKYVDIETGLLQKAKANVSSTVQTGRDRKKQEIRAVFKFVVRTAEKSERKSVTQWRRFFFLFVMKHQ